MKQDSDRFGTVDINVTVHGEEYDDYLDTLEEWILEDIDRKNQKVLVTMDGGSFEAELKDLLMNLILFKPFRVFGYRIDVSNWFDGNPRKDLPNYFDEVILFFGDSNPQELNIELSDVIMRLSELASRVNMRVATTISTYDIRQAMNAEPRLRELSELSFGHLTDYKEIERAQDEVMDEVEALLLESDTSLGEMVRADAVNKNQLKRVMVGLGPKSDLQGQLVPHLPDTTFLRGMRNICDFYAVAESGRKTIITMHRSVRLSGYLTRKLSLLAIDTLLDPDCPDCGTEHSIEVEMTSVEMMRRYRGRWCVIEKDGDPFIITDDHEDDLVGRNVWVRSPLTCAGDKICQACYGRLSAVNKDLHVGIIAVLHLTSQLTQKLLSAKHLVQTKSPDLDWPTLFRTLFNVERTTITVADEPPGWMVFGPEAIQEDDETGEMMVEQLVVDLPVSGGKRGERVTKTLELPTPLYFTESFLAEMEEHRNPAGTYEINLKNLSDRPLFVLRIQNRELTTSLNQIKSLIENKDHLGIRTIDGIAQKMMELLVTNGIELDAVHSEVILRNMVRLKNDHSKRPDFSEKELGEYVLLRLVDAILQSSSVIQSLSFQDIRRQLMDPHTYEKMGASMLDPLYGG